MRDAADFGEELRHLLVPRATMHGAGDVQLDAVARAQKDRFAPVVTLPQRRQGPKIEGPKKPIGEMA